MNSPGVLLDTGQLIALLAKADVNHDRARTFVRQRLQYLPMGARQRFELV